MWTASAVAMQLRRKCALLRHFLLFERSRRQAMPAQFAGSVTGIKLPAPAPGLNRSS
jgi:hypothetical protein